MAGLVEGILDLVLPALEGDCHPQQVDSAFCTPSCLRRSM